MFIVAYSRMPVNCLTRLMYGCIYDVLLQATLTSLYLMFLEVGVYDAWMIFLRGHLFVLMLVNYGEQRKPIEEDRCMEMNTLQN